MRLEDQAALIIAVGDLLAVRAVTGAIRAADQASAAAKGFGLGTDRVEISGRRTIEPEPRYEPRRVIHPEPRYEPRPVIHPEPRPVVCPIDTSCVPCEKFPPRNEGLPPVWKIPIERIVEPLAASMIKAAPHRADVIRRGSLLDVFM